MATLHLYRSTALVLLVLFGVSLPVVAATTVSAPPDPPTSLPQWQPRSWHDIPVRIALTERAAVADLLSAVPLAEFDRSGLAPADGGWTLTVRVTEAEASRLEAAGYAYERLTDQERAGRMAVEAAWRDGAAALRVPASAPAADKSDLPFVTTYPTQTQIGTLLADLAAAYPAICRTVSLGQSVQGREMWGIVISADVNSTTAEPEVLLTGSIHGDEVVSMTLLLNLAHHLALNYGQPGYAALTDLVDHTEIHIMPLHNPDGYVAGTRRNANGVDLNRNFGPPAGTDPVRQVENLNYMAYAAARHFVISSNGHGGALVVNYPWDYTYTRAPDDAALIRLSLEYSTWNLPMYNGGFSQGITNGADWYVVTGSLQDWAYDQTDCIDLTIEQGNIKWPAATSLAGYWNDNRESYLHLIAAAHYGINGVVSDSLSGAPLDAVVSVAGNSKSVHTDPAHGDYYKLLDTGTYSLTFAADGYRTKTISGISTVWGTPTVVDVALRQLATPVPGAATVRLAVAAWPNPFNPVTSLQVTVPERGPVRLGVYDLGGRLVRDLTPGEMTAGEHAVVWDGRTGAGALAPSGTYFARAATAAGSATTKLMLVK